MNMIKRLLFMATVGLLLVAAAVKFTNSYSAVVRAAWAANEASESAQPKKAVYVPPKRGAPKRRVGGATRGTGDEDIFVTVIAPEGTGLTSRESPTLYWFVSRAPIRQVDFALIRDDQIEPVAELTLSPPSSDGIAKVSLAELGVKLEAGVTYEWSIALVKDRLSRSSDIVTSGTMLRKVPDATLATRLNGENAEGRFVLYGEAGYWYDAIDLASKAISSTPASEAWRSRRASFLEQVGLEEVAAYDRPT